MPPLLLIAVSLALGQAPADLLYQDFRGGQFPEASFPLFNKGAKRFVKPEKDGVHFVLPADEKVPMMGFECRQAVHGDFEVTVSYELLRLDRPKDGYGVGWALTVVADSPGRDHATIARRAQPKGDVYGSDRYAPKVSDKHNTRAIATSEKRGKLRLARVGKQINYGAQGEKDEDFKVWRTEPYPDDPLHAIRVTADTGTSLGLDVRIIDLRIRTSGVPARAVAPSAGPAAAPAPGPAPSAPAEPRRAVWLITLLATLGVLLLLGGIVTWWAVRRQQEVAEEPRPRPRKNKISNVEH